MRHRPWKFTPSPSSDNYTVEDTEDEQIFHKTNYYQELPSAQIAEHLVKCHNLVGEFGGDIKAIYKVLHAHQAEIDLFTPFARKQKGQPDPDAVHFQGTTPAVVETLTCPHCGHTGECSVSWYNSINGLSGSCGWVWWCAECDEICKNDMVAIS